MSLKIAFVGNFAVDYSSENHHARSLELLGHTVYKIQEGNADAGAILQHAIKSDLLIWIHTHSWFTPSSNGYDISGVMQRLKEKNIPTLTYHLDLWLGLERQKDLETDPFYKDIEYFFTVDKQMADWFNQNTNVKGRYLQAGVFDQECYLAKEEKQIDVTFVGSKGYHPEWQYRPQLINWLKEEYGSRFVHVGGDGEIPTTRGHKLNQHYAKSKVVIGDSLCINYDYPYYWSDRVYETLGRGGFIIHPYIKGMEKHFTDKKHLVFYEFGNFEQLKYLIEHYLYFHKDREKIRLAGHEHVKKNHTYKNRWEYILNEISQDK